MLGISITHFAPKSVALAKAIGAKTLQIENDLNSGVVKAATAYFPEGEVARELCITVCDKAIQACDLLVKAGQNRALTSTLAGLGADITQIQHGDNTKHDFSYFVSCFQHVWTDVFSHKATMDTEAAVDKHAATNPADAPAS